MKCVCGYEHEMDWGRNVAIKGDDEFKRAKETIRIYKGRGEYSPDYTIFICPKCGTLKIDV